MTRTICILLYLEERKSNSYRIHDLISKAMRPLRQKRSNEISQQHEKWVCWYNEKFSKENAAMWDVEFKN